MSPILINSTTNVPPKSANFRSDEEKGEEETEKAREERKQTGRSIAIIIFLSLMCLALYHVIQRKTTILAGVLVPALILFAYTFFVIHISNRDKKRRKKLEADELQKLNEQTISEASITPSTSSKHRTSSSTPLQQPKSSKSHSNLPDSSKIAKTPNHNDFNKPNAPTGVKKKGSIKRTPSHSHVQLKSNQSAHIAIENEIKMLKKSRSFNKNNHLESARHLVIDNKKIKTKH